MFFRIIALVRKELHALVRDNEARQLLIMPVLLQLLLFPFAATLEVKNNTLAVFNEDAGATSTELIQRFGQARAFTHIIAVHSEHEFDEVIGSQRALLALRFPPGFSRAILAEKMHPSKSSWMEDDRTAARSQRVICRVCYGDIWRRDNLAIRRPRLLSATGSTRI